MDEIEQRLKDSAENCIKCYEAWRKNEKDSKIREGLQDAVHEIRKVASRLEIELAVSERDEMAQRPIPIPPHRDARGRHQNNHHEDDDNNIGNHDGEPRARSGGGGAGQRRSSRQGGPRRSGGGNNQPKNPQPSSDE